jgi:hypothetical protein
MLRAGKKEKGRDAWNENCITGMLECLMHFVPTYLRNGDTNPKVTGSKF